MCEFLKDVALNAKMNNNSYIIFMLISFFLLIEGLYDPRDINLIFVNGWVAQSLLGSHHGSTWYCTYIQDWSTPLWGSIIK